jgi:hypothetical protein
MLSLPEGKLASACSDPDNFVHASGI